LSNFLSPFHVPHFFGLFKKELANDAVTNRATGGDVEAWHADDALACEQERWLRWLSF
jgi:hypothetical protein